MSTKTNTILEGYLHKKGVYNKSWKRRYFVLYSDRTIDYFKDKAKAQNNRPKGTINLTTIKRVEIVEYIHGKSTKQALHNDKTSVKSSLECLYSRKSNIISSIAPPPSYSTIIKSEQIESRSSSDALFAEYQLTDCDEDDTFHNILNSTTSGLKCDRAYSFALISSNREWILSAENDKELKEWMIVLSTLSQGKEVHNGYLNGNKYYVLYRNKVLNCERNNKIDISIDLRHILYLKYDRNITIEIAVRNMYKEKQILFTAANEYRANEWYSKIRSLYYEQEMIYYLYNTLTQYIHIIHDGSIQKLKDKYIALYRDYIVIFGDEMQFESIRDMRFFDKAIFREYLSKEQCILIPLNDNIKVKRASKNHGENAFVISNAVGNRKWYFYVKTKDTLQKWMDLLYARKNTKKSLNKKYTTSKECDMEIESTFSVKTKEEQQKHVDCLKLKAKQSLKLSSILDEYPHNVRYKYSDTPRCVRSLSILSENRTTM